MLISTPQVTSTQGGVLVNIHVHSMKYFTACGTPLTVAAAQVLVTMQVGTVPPTTE